jgi:class 3 adenylate cyclase
MVLMSSFDVLPSALAAAHYYFCAANEQELAQQFTELWRTQQLEALHRAIESALNPNESTPKDVHYIAALQELKNLQVHLHSLRFEKLKATDNKGHILVVSPDEPIRKQVCRPLERIGHHLKIASSERSTYDALARQHSELILIDLAVDNFRGLQLLRKLKADPQYSNLPVILFAKSPNTDIAAEAISSGAYDFLSKPFQGAMFNARIAAALNNSQQRELEDFENRQAERKHQLMHQLAGRFLNHAVVDTLLSQPQGTDLGGELREVTLLMCDMRGFTTIADSLEPQQVVTLLNHYLGAMTEVVHEHGGIVNEFEGDSLLALFNAPLQLHEHTVSALRCAVAMQQAIHEVNEKNARDQLPNIGIGIGVVRGEVVVGNMGSERRTKYGVVGSPVNLAARLQSAAAAGEIVALASQLGEGAGGARILRTQKVLPKGFLNEVEVAVLVAPDVEA